MAGGFGRRWALVALALLLPGLGASDEPAAPKSTKAGKMRLYVGTYTGKESKGIYRFDFDPAAGKLTNKELAGESANPSFVAIHPNRRFLYAVAEIGELNGKKTGAVRAFAIDPETGNLTTLNQQPSGGAGPCHLVVDRQGKHVLVANYGGGSASVIPIEEDGRLGAPTDVVQHKGSSVNPQRQEGPHAHSINLDPANRFAFVCDLGLDKVLIYRYDAVAGKLTPNDPAFAEVAPGSGPRHLAFHPSGKYVYVISEMKNTITVFDYDAERGALKLIQTISTLPKDFSGESYTAEVVAHPSGKFVYGSNRKGDSIAVFAVDQETGKLRSAGWQGHHVKTPRNFTIDPTGSYLMVGNQDGDSIVVFRIDGKTGELEPTGTEVKVPMPVCLRFVPLGR